MKQKKIHIKKVKTKKNKRVKRYPAQNDEFSDMINSRGGYRR